MRNGRAGAAGCARYKSLLVCLDSVADNSPVIRVAGELADLFGSHVIGVCAAPVLERLCDEGTAVRTASIKDRAAIEKDLERCANEFQAGLNRRACSREWRSTVTFESAADYLAVQARSADLIISRGAMRDARMEDDCQAYVGRLAIKAGRPLLLVPESAPELTLARAIVAWKDTREARRAVSNSLPFLQLADKVTLLSITGDDERVEAERQLKEVCDWLRGHDVSSEESVVSTNSSKRGYLHAELLSRRCDFLVAGAYGRSRLDEWVFGGVTRNILLEAERLTLVSH